MIHRKPEWLKIKLPGGGSYQNVKKEVEAMGLHTICTSGKCPNLAECWSRGTATFMILGDICTRSCKFCNTRSGKPPGVDFDEPRRIAESVRAMKLKHAVITSVDRDDLPDFGAGIWAETIRLTKELNPETTVEVLIPDFNGNEILVGRVIAVQPEVISHNLETVRRLTPQVRSVAKYDLSLKVIAAIAESGLVAKSGLMLGLGETNDEVAEAMADLRKSNCEVLTLGQYLQPTLKHWPVDRYVTPKQFRDFAVMGLDMGFRIVESGPLVRSSYKADGHVRLVQTK